ncbi:hypothetical protein phytr_2490 [Candidatus Phycorickettsia trachydisci]|uniref:Uncharacterized protein n=1 Tax=Candidatus Phycorickettsia trachydisci TaxID=2115978 RepID=A0A2P1P7G8_9RICK|nr:hypothetical protein [Candidatus Phycorickettsia trachydisci]AVP87206.1 hypothetical protein phytr_2490 [Candidatus Phycorickettsia trachydisci]
MITLLASITGFFSSILPEILKLLKDKNDKKHELEVFDRQIKFSKLKEKYQLDELDARADILEQTALYSTYKTGIGWLDALNGTIRPILAYSFFLMYCGIKTLQYLAIKNGGGELYQYVQVLWTVDDQAIFAGIISFYFGHRTFSKFLRNKEL